jgi:hypothetical protein
MALKTFTGSTEREVTKAKEKWLSDNPNVVVKNEVAAPLRKPTGQYAPIEQGTVEAVAITIQYDDVFSD